MLSYAQYFVELSLIDIKMLQYSASAIAASGVILAYKIINQGLENVLISQSQSLDSGLHQALGFGDCELAPCMQDLYSLQVRGEQSSLQAVRKKYSNSKYAAVHPYLFPQLQRS